MRCFVRWVLVSAVSLASACQGESGGGGKGGESTGPLPPVVHHAAVVEWAVPGDYWTFDHGAWNGGHGWAFRDLDGDGLRDLIDLTEGGVVRGLPERPHWLFHRNTGAGFAPVAEWPLPPGGDPDCGIDEVTASYPERGDLWIVHDVTGDRRPDLVFTGLVGVTRRAILGGTENPHWNVHRNLGNGFALEAEEWPIPAGEARVARGWVNVPEDHRIISGDYPAGTLADLDGDGLADLVVTAEEESEEYAGPKRVPGHAEGTPHWWLFRGTGSGFSAPVAWPVPIGWGSAPEGRPNGGYADVAGGDRNHLGEIWVVRDLDGDARPELVVTGSRDGRWACSMGWTAEGPGWAVYPNTGTGFAEREEWPLPALVGPAWDDGFCESEKPFDYFPWNVAPHWEHLDLDADGVPELVQTSEGVPADEGGLAPVSLRLEDGRPIWWVHGGGAGGFGRPEPWVLPGELPGLVVDPVDRGPAWMLTDMTGDRYPDLVVIVRDTDGVTRRWRVLPYVP